MTERIIAAAAITVVTLAVMAGIIWLAVTYGGGRALVIWGVAVLVIALGWMLYVSRFKHREDA